MAGPSAGDAFAAPASVTHPRRQRSSRQSGRSSSGIGSLSSPVNLKAARGRHGAWTRTAALVRGGDTAAAPSVLTSGVVLDLIQPHSVAASEVLQYYGVTEEGGLSAEEAAKRKEQYGANSLQEAPRQSLLSMILEQFEDRLVQILLAVAVLSGVLSMFEEDPSAFVEPASIVLILVLNAIIGVWQSRSAQDSLEALKALQPETACVLRDGQWISSLPAEDLVPGDIVYLRVGDKIAADARIIALKTTTFMTDEASLTGESLPAAKSVEPVPADSNIPLKCNTVFSGTMVTGGGAWAVITATGMRTEIGKISAGVQQARQEEEKTPLQQKLDEFGGKLTWIIGTICIAVWCISIPHFNDPMFGSVAKGAVYYAKVAVALGVAAIPEGLPAVITLCLSLGTRRMAKRNVIVRKLPSVETLGCTTVICTDKTGTLTTNQMTVMALVTVDGVKNTNTQKTGSGTKSGGEAWTLTTHECGVSGVSYEPIGSLSGMPDKAMSHKGWQDLAKACAICNDAKIVFEKDKYCRVGEPTEAALQVLVEKLGVHGIHRSADPVTSASQCSTYWQDQYTRLATLEFNRDRKSMSVLCKPTDDREGGGGTNRLFVKGAPEMLLARCTKVMLAHGEVVPLTPALRTQLEKKFTEMATRPLRCLALALKEGKELGVLEHFREDQDASQDTLLNNPKNFEGIESGLTFLGMAGIKDPARPEVADAMLLCQKAGVRVFMITGDSKETAIAIARDVNIFGAEEDVSARAWVSRDFFSLDVSSQKALLASGNLVFCRTEPADKQKLVKMLQEMGEVPAMTGDGVNDAPALQQAAIGIAMGQTGTEVSKDAADMILADDNFATIVSAVEEGRAIYNNMQAFICFLISCNIGEIATIFFATLLGLPEPLTPLHLLWVNLVTDGPPATALGFNPPDPDAMTKPPRPRDEPIMSSWLLTRYITTGLYVGFATIGVFVHWYLDHGVTWQQLLGWSQCSTWEGFDVPAIEGMEYLIGNPCEIFTTGRCKAQSLSLSVLVTMEMLKALSAVSVDSSMLRVPPWKNPWLLLGVAVPSLLHLAVIYTPAVAHMFDLAPLTWEDWTYVLRFAVPIILVEEILKAIGRGVNSRKEEKQRAALAAAAIPPSEILK